MKYHDTGSKDASHALAWWFEGVLDDNVAELRVQSGYFRVDAARAIASALKRAVELNLPVKFVIGSNESDTTASDLSLLMAKIGMPRDTAKLGVIGFSNALFHPKVYHIVRNDGTQAAFVGSANFTSPGVTGTNVEAAVSLDSAKGDSEEVLSEIAAAVDRWFIAPVPEGISLISAIEDLEPLVAAGLLSVVRPPRISKKNPAGEPGVG